MKSFAGGSTKKEKCFVPCVEALESRCLLSATVPGVTLDPLVVPKFVNTLPNPLDSSFIYQPTSPGGSHYEVGVYQVEQDLGLGLKDDAGNPVKTTVWGYGTSAATATYPGRSFEVQSNQQIDVHWTNGLLDSAGNPLPHLLPVDTTLLDPKITELGGLSTIGVPIVTHVHGGHTEAASDGTPMQWYGPLNAPDGEPLYVGDDYVKKTFTYDNTQEAATIWYHDHAMGVTRLNVYAGLAGFYIVHDTNENNLVANHNLPSKPYDIPLAIQDRLFTTDGQLYYPAEPEPGTTAAYPSIHPEFFGDTILVNGKAWPVLDVEPRMYRFRIVDGSNSRFYNLSFAVQQSPSQVAFAGPSQQFFQVGTDSGLLEAPVPLNQVLLGPGERADIVFDFSKLAGKTILLLNDAKGPYPKGEPVDPLTTGQIMAFRVTLPKDASVPDTVLPTTLNVITPLGTPDNTRELALYEEEDEYGRLIQQLGTLAGPEDLTGPITEIIQLGDKEIWKIYNVSADTHPIHLHQVSFQIISRQKFNWTENEEIEGITVTRLIGQPTGPDANEAGWKDTARMNPGEVTVIEARFDVPGKYVWHCHILEHEEHDMMRFFEVVAPSALATVTASTESDLSSIAAASPLDGSSDSALRVQSLTRAASSGVVVGRGQAAVGPTGAAADRALSATDVAGLLYEARRTRRARPAVFDDIYAQFNDKPLIDLFDGTALL